MELLANTRLHKGLAMEKRAQMADNTENSNARLSRSLAASGANGMQSSKCHFPGRAFFIRNSSILPSKMSVAQRRQILEGM